MLALLVKRVLDCRTWRDVLVLVNIWCIEGLLNYNVCKTVAEGCALSKAGVTGHSVLYC